ncbi:MAG: hypothetical protein VX938_03485, partial [Myxococcota bacterium]|nr:hypothetical protein [Myxococcota bacterium]
MADYILGDVGSLQTDSQTQQAVAYIPSTSASNDDTLKGEGGDDSVLGGGGADDITTAAGDDAVLGDYGWISTDFSGSLVSILSESDVGGKDKISLGEDGQERNYAVAGGGDDTVAGGAGVDVVVGDSGEIQISDASGQEVSADTALFLTGGVDLIETYAGQDLVIGSAMGDIIDSGTEDDAVLGDFGTIVGSLAGDLYSIVTYT